VFTNSGFIKNEHVLSRRKFHSILHDFGRSLLLIVDPESLQASIAARIHELFGCDRVVIFQSESGRQMFKPCFSFGISLDKLPEYRRRNPSGTYG